MNASDMLRYLLQQAEQIELLIRQLDEIQVAFNAQFDNFRSRHDAQLERLGEQIFERLRAEHGTVAPGLESAIEAQLPAELDRIEERRAKLRDEYLPQRREAADSTLQEAQAEMKRLRALNPTLDREEEDLKAQKAELEAQLGALNDQIHSQSRGLRLLRHFPSILRADRERQRIIGQLEALAQSLHKVRLHWEHESASIREKQQALQDRWQLESIAVARLQTELDQLDDEDLSQDLALRRAIRHVLDGLKVPVPGSNPDLDASLAEMIELNIQTDTYHEGLASVGGLIGLLRGIRSGLDAIHASVEALDQEQEMHSAYLKPLDFQLPAGVDRFHDQWPELARRFADEKTIGQHPADFQTQVEPLLQGPLSEASIEASFQELGKAIERAAAAW